MSDALHAVPLLELRGVSKRYEDGNVWALRNVDLKVATAEYISVMGKSGCGKSTLLNLLGALDRPTSGEILFEGQPLHQGVDLDRFRSHKIGFVFQSYYLLPSLTASENVQIPMFESDLRRSQRSSRALELLTKVGLEAKARQFPTKLSGGERQRVAIARALANSPTLLLADEPTGNLDSKTADGILDLFQNLIEDETASLVVVTHDALVAGRATRRIEMNDGLIVSDSSRNVP